MADDTRPAVVTLPRGGYVVVAGGKPIQFGAPPETIKDTMISETGVPEIFVLPHEMFHWEKGINVADMEFPIYFNYFIKKKRVTVLGNDRQAVRLAIALQEAVFGPKNLNLEADRFEAGDDAFVPDIKGELAYFRAGNTLNQMVRFIPFRDGIARLEGGVEVRRNEAGPFEVRENGRQVALIPAEVDYEPIVDTGAVGTETFHPPIFGVTCLGPSHGFDPNDNTSGFIIWLNGNGIMVDPPVNSTEWLLRSGVSPKLIDSIILTHCHADHDAGTFQKILEEGRVTIYTTKTIMQSFLRKYAAFSGEKASFLAQLFNFNRVYIGRPFFLHGGEFEVFYSFHSIPTMAFRLRFQGKTFVYSSDHQADPGVQDSLLEKGLISDRRREQFANFPWDSDVVYHESGIAPLHTPIEYLSSLAPEIKSKCVVYHISRKDFDAEGDQYLRRATFGIENTLRFETQGFDLAQGYKLLDVIKRIDFIADMRIEKLQQFFAVVRWVNFPAGEAIISIGDPGDTFYILVSGNASITSGALLRNKRLGPYEYFGEVALLTGSPRTADVIAETEVEALAISKPQFLSFISGTRFEVVLRRLIERRSEETWNTMIESPFFSKLNDYQKMWLESAFVPREFHGEGVIIEQGQPLPGVYLIRSGEVIVEQDDIYHTSLQHGDMIGMIHRIQRGEEAEFTFRHESDVACFFIGREDVQQFAARNPGVGMRLAYRF